MSLVYEGIAERQGIAQHFIQRQSLVSKQGVTCRYSHHQWIVPDRFRNEPIASFIRLGKPYVVQVVMKPLELLRQGHLGQTNLDLRLFLPPD